MHAEAAQPRQRIPIFYTMGDGLNGSLSIPAGAFAIFLKVDQTLDWRAAAFT